jgi:hypothetical protein
VDVDDARADALARCGVRGLSVLQLRAHPSCRLELANEIAFNGHRGGQAAYVERAARAARRLDPGRPVALDLWGTTSERRRPHLAPRRRGRRHDYQGWYAQPGAPAAVTREAIAAFLERLHRSSRPTSWRSRSSAPRPTARTRRLRPAAWATRRACWPSSIAAYRADPRLDGMLVWNLQDFALTPRFDGGSIRGELPDIRLRRGVNQKGLFTYGGEPKPAALAVARAFRSGR